MSDPSLSDFKVLVFDCYGTLIDWESGIYNALKPLLTTYVPSWSRKEGLVAFSAVESDLQAQHPEMLYSKLLEKAHEVFEARLRANKGLDVGAGGVTMGEGTTTLEGDPASSAGAGSSSNSSTAGPVETSDAGAGSSITEPKNPHVIFGESIKDWIPFPDTIAALQSLSKHYKLVILSNVDRTSFEHTRKRLKSPEGIDPFTMVLTAQDTGAYKPSLIPFQKALAIIATNEDSLFPPNTTDKQVLCVAQSLHHDHVPAKQLGLKSVYINREGAVMGSTATEEGRALYDWRFETLGEMAAAVTNQK